MKYLLTKLSSPSWEKTFTSEESLFEVVDSCVCSNCKISTYEEMKASFESDPNIGSFAEEDILTELEYCCVDEGYEDMTTSQKIDELMHTACGCEYMLESLL